MALAKRFLGASSFPVGKIPASVPLPAGLVIPPGLYVYGGETYDCAAEGRYLFAAGMQNTQQRIVFQSDVAAMMSALAWCVVNGRADEGLTIGDKTTRATTSKLRMLCGKTVEWAKAICDSPSIGIQSRTVRTLTAGAPNGYYDGHVLLEAKVGGAWVTFDLANNLRYQAAAGSALKDVVPLNGAMSRAALALDGYSIEPSAAGQFDVTAWQEMTMQDPADFNAELDRVLQIPGIDHPTNGEVWWYLPPGMEGRSAWVLSLQANYRVKSQAEWLAQFYP